VSRPIKVGVKYCGHCNPRLHGPEVIRTMQDETTEFQFTGWEDPQKEILLIVDACRCACATRPSFEGPVVCLRGIPIQGEEEENNHWATEQLLASLRSVYAELQQNRKGPTQDGNQG